jgi:hypothetical protein
VGPDPAGHVDSSRGGPAEPGAPGPSPSIGPSPSPTQPAPTPQPTSGIVVVPPVVYTSPSDDSGGRHRGSGN